MTVFTAQRIGEIVPAQWSEVDLEKGAWSIPRDRMKRKDAERGPHIVPIPSKLLAMMREWRRADGDDAGFVCPAPNRDAPVTREAVEKLYRRGLGLSGRHSPHAWRSVFSSWARDAGKEGDAIEAQLDHVVGNKVAAAYDRAKRVELRRSLMIWYEAQLLAARDGAEVVPLRKASSPH
jgi:integrase